MGSIVVGVDESAGAAEALRWAAEEGKLRGWPVTAVLCWGYLDQHHGTLPPQPFDPEYSSADAARALQTIVERVLGEGAAAIERRIVNDLPVRGLLEAAADASLLVLGARGLGPFRELLLGSVSHQCLHHAKVPVAIIREDGAPHDGERRIVVGVDGSETSQRALDWALEEARLRRAHVDVVHGWSLPALAVPTLTSAYDAFEQAAHTVVARALEQADTAGLPAPPRPVVRCGTGGQVIVEQAEGAELVIVGSRGLGGFRGLLLGSVSHQVTHHAPCPVIVIPQVADEAAR